MFGPSWVEWLMGYPSDGISGKAALDGLVKAGIFPDDSAKFTKEVTHSQEKTKGEEVTEILIYEVE